jgi:hypothetical protein
MVLEVLVKVVMVVQDWDSIYLELLLIIRAAAEGVLTIPHTVLVTIM